MFALTICIFVFVPFTFSLFWRSLLHSLLVFCQHCSLFFLYWQWISLKYTVFIVLSVVYIWGVISYNTLLSKSVQIKFKMFIIHTNFLLFFCNLWWFWYSIYYSRTLSQCCYSLFILYWQWISLRVSVFILLSVVFIWSVIYFD